MLSADLRRSRSVTRIPVSVNGFTSPETVPNSVHATTGESQLSSSNTARSNAASNGRRLSLSSAVAAVTFKEPLESQMDSSMETVFRRWDAETTSVAIAEATPSVRVGLQHATPVTKGRIDNLTGDELGRLAVGSRQRSSAASRCDAEQKPDIELFNASDQSLAEVKNGRTITSERRHRTDNNNNCGLRIGNGAATTRSQSETRYPSSTDSTLRSSTRLPNGTADRGEVFHVEFDADGYRPEDISVHVTGSRLTVHGVHRETDDPEESKVRKDVGGLRRTTTEFCRRIRLPDDVDRAGLTCVIVGGQVIIEAPRVAVPCRPTAADESPVTESVRTPRAAAAGGGASNADRTSPLNTPTVRTSVDGTVREVSLSVEVGRLFRPDDVTVKVKNSTLTLTVVAERVERSPLTSVTGSSEGEKATNSDNLVGGGVNDVVAGGSWRRLNANLTWEFDLPGALEVDTLKAGLTMDGLLKITATMKQLAEKNESADKV